MSLDLYVIPRFFISLTTELGKRPETDIAYTPFENRSTKKHDIINKVDNQLIQLTYLFFAIYRPTNLQGSLLQLFYNKKTSPVSFKVNKAISCKLPIEIVAGTI